jgi:hypothetical protein
MRIDGPSPIPSAGSEPVVREAKPHPAPEAAPAVVKDRLDTQPRPEISSTNILVEMQPGNIVVYKFIDEASGRLIQQIPSEQMLNLAEPARTSEGKKKS